MPFVFDLLRHGEALPAADGDDAGRRLSPRGERDLERLARHLERQGWRPHRAFTSPLLRAVESARIVLGRAVPELAPAVTDALRPDAEPARAMAELNDAGNDRHLLLVGHQPLLGNLAAAWTGGEAPGLSPGDLLRIEFQEAPALGTGRLLWRIRGRDCA